MSIAQNRLGYCCINMTLWEQGFNTNRGMVKKTFLDRGLKYASELALKNVKDLQKVIRWNYERKISLYRITSDLFPWCSEYELHELPDYNQIVSTLNSAGSSAMAYGQRLTFHPSHFCILASLNPDVITKSLKELRQHGEIMDLMGLERSHQYPINIHVNTSNPTKEAAADRFCKSFDLLDDTAKLRLVVENDDKKAGFTPTDLYELLHKRINIPITFDFLHFKCNPDSLSEEEALQLSISTWGQNRALTHYSESKKIFEDISAKEVAHSDWIYNKINTYGKEFSIELEVKMKEKALLKYIKDFEGDKTKAIR
jgi:UV DNA damage endonuclease